MSGLECLSMRGGLGADIQNADVATLTRLFTSNRRLLTIEVESFENGDEAATALARSLSFQSSLKRFKLDSHTLSRSGIAALSQALQQPSRLENLVLRNYDLVLDHEMATTLAHGIQKNTSLSEIGLLFNEVDPVACGVLLRSFSRLRKAWWNNLKLMGQEEALASLIAESSSIEELALRGPWEEVDNSGGEGNWRRDARIYIGPILSALRSNASLKSTLFI